MKGVWEEFQSVVNYVFFCKDAFPLFSKWFVLLA